MSRFPNYDFAADPRWRGLQLLGHGYSRVCAVDPDDANYCLKFELPPHGRSKPGLRRSLQHALARRWPRFGDNALELRAWRYLQRRLGDEAAARFAASEGIVETAWGRALRCRIAHDGDHAARNLHSHLGNGSRYSREALCMAADEFARFLQGRNIPLFDLNLGNFVVVAGDDGQPRLICIDVKSVLASKEILPLSRRIPFLLRRKIARRAERLRRRILAGGDHPPTLAPSASGH